MSFKAKKLNIDLSLDLTEYISEKDGGLLTSTKTDPKTLNEWTDMAVEEGERLTDIQEKKKEKHPDALSGADIAREAKESVIRQIDFFYGKGNKFYKQLPPQTVNDILKYINTQVFPAKKK